ncbi:MAG: hypothetical protein C5B56_09625 [Proteobacteria bacterium]|jgi:hypothetical protein|nr:MAG: hypothetical protein C5B56_09625 [Pseudomonadota bacterium]
MRQARGEYKQGHGGGCGNARPAEEPGARRNWLCVERHAQTRQQRRRNFGVGFRAKAGVDGGEERLLLGESRAARRARVELRA